MTLEDRVQVQRLHLFRRAGELGSVTAAYQVAGISRSLLHRLRRSCGAGEARAQATDPRTGAEILLEARRVVTFRPSQTLKEFLNDADAWRTGQ